MGDFQTGLQVGVTVELMFLAVIFVGTAVPPTQLFLQQSLPQLQFLEVVVQI